MLVPPCLCSTCRHRSSTTRPGCQSRRMRRPCRIISRSFTKTFSRSSLRLAASLSSSACARTCQTTWPATCTPSSAKRRTPRRHFTNLWFVRPARLPTFTSPSPAPSRPELLPAALHPEESRPPPQAYRPRTTPRVPARLRPAESDPSAPVGDASWPTPQAQTVHATAPPAQALRRVGLGLRPTPAPRRSCCVIQGRYYAGRPILAQFCPVTDFKDARCRQFEETSCSRGGYCNFMHLKKVSSKLQRRLLRRLEAERCAATLPAAHATGPTLCRRPARRSRWFRGAPERKPSQPRREEVVCRPPPHLSPRPPRTHAPPLNTASPAHSTPSQGRAPPPRAPRPRRAQGRTLPLALPRQERSAGWCAGGLGGASRQDCRVEPEAREWRRRGRGRSRKLRGKTRQDRLVEFCAGGRWRAAGRRAVNVLRLTPVRCCARACACSHPRGESAA